MTVLFAVLVGLLRATSVHGADVSPASMFLVAKPELRDPLYGHTVLAVALREPGGLWEELVPIAGRCAFNLNPAYAPQVLPIRLARHDRTGTHHPEPADIWEKVPSHRATDEHAAAMQRALVFDRSMRADG